MFHRLYLEEWLHLMPRLAMIIFFTVFVVNVLRILLTPRNDHLETLPLEEDHHETHSH